MKFAILIISFALFLYSSNRGTKIAAITFATKAFTVYNLGDETVDTTAKAIKVTRQIKYSGGGTNYAKMFDEVHSNIVPFFRLGTKRALVIISDGNPNMGGAPTKQARKFRHTEKGIIYAVGIGRNVDRTFLAETTGDKKRVFRFKDYGNLEDLVLKVVNPGKSTKLMPTTVCINDKVAPQSI